MSVATDSWRYRQMTRVTVWLLLRMGKYAAKRGDWHEWRHIIAQLKAGESVGCGADCPLRGRDD